MKTINYKKVYVIKMIRDFPPIVRIKSYVKQKDIIWNDPVILEALRHAIENNKRNIKEEKYNRILAEALGGNEWAEDFIKIWNSKNIKKAWINFNDFPKGAKGKYLDEKGGFSKLGEKTWIFDSKKEASDHASDCYAWGCLADVTEIVSFDMQFIDMEKT